MKKKIKLSVKKTINNLDHGENRELVNSNLPTYKYFGILAGKFRKGESDRFQGYGVVKFPLKKRVRWTAKHP